jgi:thiamine-monophosphate kinase
MPDRAAAGEEALIQGHLARLSAKAPGALGLEDDCAILRPEPGHDLVLTTDAVAAGVHFFPDDVPADIGWKALAVNVSDLAAKSARPLAYLMALSFPEPPSHAWMSAFAGGLAEAQAAFGCTLLGGDTDRRPGPISITITAIGAVPAGCLVPRSGARPGDLVYVSGTLGDAALGLKLRQEPALARSWKLDEPSAAALRSRYLRPQPRLALGPGLREHASAAMDISDGLAKDLSRMAAASGVAAIVRTRMVPLSPAAQQAVGAAPALLDAAMTGGDDYEILCTVPPSAARTFEAAAATAGVGVTCVGEIAAGHGCRFLDEGGREITFSRPGYDHF